MTSSFRNAFFISSSSLLRISYCIIAALIRLRRSGWRLRPPYNGLRSMTRLRLKVLLAILLVPAAAAAADSGRVLWRSQAGDDPRWARPGFNDSGWEAVPLSVTWREQGRQGFDGMVWFRRVVSLDEDARLAASRDDLGLLLGGPAAGGYEVYVGGRWIGRSRGWSAELPFGFSEVFRIPREAVGKGATLSLALRARRVGW